MLGNSTPHGQSVILEQRCMYVHRVGHVAVRVQWPGVVVRVALRVVCGEGRGGTERSWERSTPRIDIVTGVSSDHPQWRPHTDESQNGIARETATRPEGAHGGTRSQEPCRVSPCSTSDYRSRSLRIHRYREGSQQWKLAGGERQRAANKRNANRVRLGGRVIFSFQHDRENSWNSSR